MIIVKNRELLIPNNERYIGTTYDTETENRIFQVPRYSQRGVDLAALTFRLDIQYANESYDTIVLDKEIGEAFVILIWRITSATLQVPGTMYIGLRAVDNEATVKWSSFSAAMYVERHLNTPGNYGGGLTEIEQMEQDHQYMLSVVNDLKANLDYAHDAEAWAQGTRNGSAVPSSDKTYQKNSKYYSEQANSSKTAAANSATAAAGSATAAHDDSEAVAASRAQIAQNASNIAIQTARIDQFTHLAEGSTTGDAELMDARVGADGVTYTSAGAATRANDSLLKSQIVELQDVVVFKVELSTLNSVVRFYVHSGDVVNVKAKDGGPMTVSQIRLVRSNGTNDYWSIGNQVERNLTMTEDFVGVFLHGGTAQTIVITKSGSYLNYDDEIKNINTAVTKAQDEIDNLNEIVGYEAISFESTSGAYIKSDGTIVSNASFSYSDPIPVSAGQKVSFTATGYSTTIAMISLVDSDGTNIVPVVTSVDDTERTYKYTVALDGYIAVSYTTSAMHSLVIFTDRIGNIESDMSAVVSDSVIIPSDLNTGYIHRDGRIMPTSNFKYTNPIRLENETITFTAKGYSNNVSLLCSCDEDGDNRINLVNSTDAEETKTITYTSNGVSYVIITSNVAVPIIYKKFKIKTVFDEPYVCLSLFENFGVIGDSYASGNLYYNNTYKNDYPHSWGQILARKLGTTCTNYSIGGLSTRTWLTNSKGLPLLLSNNPDDIYYLALGINDSYSLGMDYLGAITDITSHSSYVDYADTFYGNYGKIIEQIENHAPHAKLVMFTIAGTTGNIPAFNEAILTIADHYNIPFIVQNNDPFFMSSFYNNTKVEGHPIAITYSGMAVAFERLLNECIRNNVRYFKDAFCYDN